MRVFAMQRPVVACRAVAARLPARPVAMQSCFFGRAVPLQRSSLPGFGMLSAGRSEAPSRRGMAVVAYGNSKRCIGDTFHGSRRKRTRVSGFRTRKQTVGGRKVLNARRKRGRKVLCPAHSRKGNKSTSSSFRK